MTSSDPTKTEVGRLLSEHAGAPAMVRMWAPVFHKLGMESATKFVSAHEGLAGHPATRDGIQFLVNSVRIWLMLPANVQDPPITAPPDPMAADSSAEVISARAEAMSGMRWLHYVVHQQSKHSAESTLTNCGLGDVEGRADAEFKRARMNASKSYAEYREALSVLYQKVLDPSVQCKAELAVEMRKGMEVRHLYVPDLDSSGYGADKKITSDFNKRIVIGDNNEVVTADEEKVLCDRNGLVLLQVERALSALLAAGSVKVDMKLYPLVGVCGKVYAGLPNEHHVHFGMDAFDGLMRRWVWLSAFTNAAGLLLLWSRILIPRMATKMQNRLTCGSAALEILNSTSCLDVDACVALGGHDGRIKVEKTERGHNKKGKQRAKSEGGGKTEAEIIKDLRAKLKRGGPGDKPNKGETSGAEKPVTAADIQAMIAKAMKAGP